MTGTSIGQNSFSDDLAGIGDQNKCARFRALDEITQPHGLSAFHRCHNDRLGVMTECAFRLIDRSSAIQIMHDKLTDRLRVVTDNIEAFAFVDGTSIMLKIQSQKNTERSQTGVTEGHFATLDEALAWLKEEVKI